ACSGGRRSGCQSDSSQLTVEQGHMPELFNAGPLLGTWDTPVVPVFVQWGGSDLPLNVAPPCAAERCALRSHRPRCVGRRVQVRPKAFESILLLRQTTFVFQRPFRNM